MSEDIGFYNKYIFNNNSYLKSHLVRDVVKTHNNDKELNMKIDENLEKRYYNCPLRNEFNKCRLMPIYLKKNIKKVRFSLNTNDKMNKNVDFDNLENHDYFTKVNNKLPFIKSKCDVSINTELPELNDKSTNTKTNLDFLKRNKVHDPKKNIKQNYNLNTNNASICNRINIYNKNII